jgi:membrane protein required for colicin V production
MLYLDIIILLFLLWGAYIGYENGFVVQSFTLIALVLGIWAGVELTHAFGEFLINIFAVNSTLAFIGAFTVIFVLVLIIVHFIGSFITNRLSKSTLGTLNRIGGVCFGIIKMAFIVSIFIFIMQRFDVNKKLLPPEKTKKTILYPEIAKIAPAVFSHFNIEEIKNQFLKI